MATTACPHCGHESEADVCPLCGSEMPGAAPGAGREEPGPGAPDPAAAAGEGRPVPWEDPGIGFPVDAWRTWRESLLQPTSFFRRPARGTSLVRPVFYFLLVSVLGAFFHLIWQAYLYTPLTGEGAAYGGGLYVVQFFATPFVVLVGLGLQTLVLHLFVLMLAPQHRGIGSTTRLICYASGPAVLSAVPVLGPLAALIWSLVVEVVGIREVHRTTTGRAVVVALAPAVLVLGTALLLGVLVALTVGRGELASGSSLLPLPLP